MNKCKNRDRNDCSVFFFHFIWNKLISQWFQLQRGMLFAIALSLLCLASEMPEMGRVLLLLVWLSLIRWALSPDRIKKADHQLVLQIQRGREITYGASENTAAVHNCLNHHADQQFGGVTAIGPSTLSSEIANSPNTAQRNEGNEGGEIEIEIINLYLFRIKWVSDVSVSHQYIREIKREKNAK